MFRSWSFAAGFADTALYLVMVSLPFRALELGASSSALGLVPFLYAVPYATTAWLAGRRSDSASRVGSVRVGVTGAALGALGLAWAPSLAWMLGLIPLLGFSLAFYWPALQATVAESAGGSLARRVGWFNVGWSTGKASGFLLGGWLTATLGGARVSLVAAACFATCLLFLRPGRTDSSAPEPHPTRPPRRLAAFRLAAWLANGAAFALVATMNHHYPRLMVERGDGADRFGLLLGGVFLSQVVAFRWLGRGDGWAYRRWLFLSSLVALAGTAWMIPYAPFVALLAATPLLGLALGFFYQSSLYYSLESATSRGGHAGIHESLLGFASGAVPLLGGFLADRFADPTLPFAVAGATLGLVALAMWPRLGRPATLSP